MYYNVFGEKVSRRRYKEMCNAAKNRRELIAAGLTSRRDLMKMGLLTGQPDAEPDDQAICHGAADSSRCRPHSALDI